MDGEREIRFGSSQTSSCINLYYADPGSSDNTEYQHYSDITLETQLKGLNNRELEYTISIIPPESPIEEEDIDYSAQTIFPIKIYVWEMVGCRVNTQCGEVLLPGTNKKVETICDQVYHICRVPKTSEEQEIIKQPITKEDKDMPSISPPKKKEFNYWIIFGIIVFVGIVFYLIFRKK